MAKFNKKNVENAPDKIKAGAEEMIKAPMWMIEQILLKHEKAVLEVMKELHDENSMLRNRAELLAEDIECLHMCLDDANAPRDDGKGNTYSLWGRVQRIVHNAGGKPPEE